MKAEGTLEPAAGATSPGSPRCNGLLLPSLCSQLLALALFSPSGFLKRRKAAADRTAEAKGQLRKCGGDSWTYCQPRTYTCVHTHILKGVKILMFTLAFLDPYGVCFIYSKGEKKYLGERLSDGQQVCSGTKCENRTGKFQSYVLPPSSQGSSPSHLGSSSQQHALQLPDPALLRQAQTLCCLLLLQEVLNVAGGAQQDVSGSLHGEDGPSQNFPGSTAEKISGHSMTDASGGIQTCGE